MNILDWKRVSINKPAPQVKETVSAVGKKIEPVKEVVVNVAEVLGPIPQAKKQSPPPRPREQDCYWKSDGYGEVVGEEYEEEFWRPARVRRIYGRSGKSNYGY